MSVTAEQLSKTGARGKDIDSIVKDRLQVIDRELVNHTTTWGVNLYQHALPTTFNIPGLNKANAQRLVYSSILKDLIGRFGSKYVRLEISDKPEKTTLYIAWVTDVDKNEIDAMTSLIKAQRVETGGVQAWLDGLGRPADRHNADVNPRRQPQGAAAIPSAARAAAAAAGPAAAGHGGLSAAESQILQDVLQPGLAH